MKTAVIYKSKYGATKTYAQWIAEDLKADLLEADKVKPADLQKYQTIVYGGGIYAGGISGVSLIVKNFEAIKDKSLFLFTVGASNPEDEKVIQHIRSSIANTLSPAMLNTIKLYHLRGGMKYSKMSFIHRKMMGMMIKMLKKKPESELSAEDKMMIDSFGLDQDFTDKNTIKPMLADIRACSN